MNHLRLLVLWSILGIVLLPVLPVAAQEDSPPPAAPADTIEITAIDTSNYPEVRVYVAALDGALPDPATITVREDNAEIAPDNITTATERTGVAVAVVLDLSRSMRGSGLPTSTDRLEDARDQIATLAQALNPETDLLLLQVFNQNTVEVLPLAPVDGGAVVNQLNTDPTLQVIPDKPGGPTSQPTAEDYRNDPYAFAALSDSLQQALAVLTDPDEAPAAFADRLPRMQKAVLLLGDSCDDGLTAIGSAVCTIPSDLQTTLEAANESGDLTIYSIGVGNEDPDAGRPKPPRVPEAGYAYNSQWELLERLANEVPNGAFVPLATDDPAQVAALETRIADDIIAPIVQRGDQLVITYTSPAQPTVGHTVTIEAGDARSSMDYAAPRVPPQVTLDVQPGDEETRPVVGVNIVTDQAPIDRAEYFINGSDDPIVSSSPPFALDTSQLEPGEYTVTVRVEDIRGLVSEMSAEAAFTVPAPPPDYTLFWAVPLGLLVLGGVGFLLWSMSRRQPAPTVASNAGASQRVTRVYDESDLMLVIRKGKQTGSRHPIGSTQNTFIGADPAQADIVLEDDYVSGRHVSIQREGDNLFAIDLGSRNGTQLNNERMVPNQRYPFKPHDALTVGSTVLQCMPANSERDNKVTQVLGPSTPPPPPVAAPGKAPELPPTLPPTDRVTPPELPPTLGLNVPPTEEDTLPHVGGAPNIPPTQRTPQPPPPNIPPTQRTPPQGVPPTHIPGGQAQPDVPPAGVEPTQLAGAQPPNTPPTQRTPPPRKPSDGDQTVTYEEDQRRNPREQQ